MNFYLEKDIPYVFLASERYLGEKLKLYGHVAEIGECCSEVEALYSNLVQCLPI